MKRKILAIALAVGLLTVLAVPTVALAVADDSVVTGNMPTDTIEIAAPADITIATSLYGTTGDATGTSATPGTVLCTHEGGYSLDIESDDVDGKMQEAGAGHLTAALKVTADLSDDSGAVVTQVIGDDQVITTAAVEVGNTSGPAPEEGGVNNIALSVAQPKQTTGTAGDYTLTLTFTAEAN